MVIYFLLEVKEGSLNPMPEEKRIYIWPHKEEKKTLMLPFKTQSSKSLEKGWISEKGQFKILLRNLQERRVLKKLELKLSELDAPVE